MYNDIKTYIAYMTYSLLCFMCISMTTPAFSNALPYDAVRKAQHSLNSITTMQARFTQLGADGSYAEGTFYFQRPGNIRWDYDDPHPVLIVARGKSITYYDRELEQISYISADAGIASFLTRDTIDFFASDVVIQQAQEHAGQLHVTLMQRQKPEEGSLTLTFEGPAYILRQMIVTDTAKKQTHITFSHNRYSMSFDKKLFFIPNPKVSTPGSSTN